MIFSLDVRRARKGDCLLLHYGTRSDPGLVLIDGGPAQVLKPHLQPRFADVRKARALAGADALPIDVLMISHIDDDHIKGILELTSELVEAKRAKQPLPLKIRSLWHNTFDDLIDSTPDELLSAVTAQFGAASLAAEPDPDDGLDRATAGVLASVPQGARLRDDAKNLGLRLNPHFGGKLVMASAAGKPVDVGKGLSFTVAGPMQDELIGLQKAHDAFLKQQEAKSKRALASFSDDSPANLSSIVVLAEAGGKRMLLTGDARGDKIIRGLELIGALEPGKTMHVDLLKMPHHGSDRNMEQSFLERIVADHYVFSGDGEHGNPERATLEMLRLARGDAHYTVHLTYPIDGIDVERQKDWEKEQEKERKKKSKGKDVEVREDWSAQKHSLTAFFADHPDMAGRVAIAGDHAAHVIDLLDPIGF
jgi:hypothetical protein